MTKPFLFGAATSSHQVEGQNIHNDWWAWEQSGRVAESSGQACDHYHRFEEDFDHIVQLGHNSHRFSIEWSRLQPEEGVWDSKAIEHYTRVFEALKVRGIEPIVTLHHFTNPVWFSKKGGWEKEENIPFFLAYVQKVTELFSPYVQYWVTFNEPMVYIYYGYFEGIWPPGKKSFPEALLVLKNFLKAHIRSYQLIHQESRKQNRTAFVSIAKHMIHFTPYRRDSVGDRISTYLRHRFFNQLFLDALWSGFLFFPGLFCEFLEDQQTIDFVGLNYYTHDQIQFSGFGGTDLLGQKVETALRSVETNHLGWEVFPEGLYQLLLKLKKYSLPVLILENGICTPDDQQREAFIEGHLDAVERARAEGIPVQGYFYWSLLDNFEWAEGFEPRFGILEVDYASQARKVRSSAQVLTRSCRKFL